MNKSNMRKKDSTDRNLMSVNRRVTDVVKATKPIMTPEEFLAKSEDFRIGAVISDGMWWAFDKWASTAKVDKDVLKEWVDSSILDGTIEKSATGAGSYRMTTEKVKEWHRNNRIGLDQQIIEGIYPARIWAGITETDGLLGAPRRECATISFSASSRVAQEVKRALRGVGRVRYEGSGRYRVFSLSGPYAKGILEATLDRFPKSESKGSINISNSKLRRELIDFPEGFMDDFMPFYMVFSRVILKNKMDAFRIYIPDREDQDTQIALWVINAVEKFNENASVPFSGYLSSDIRYRLIDLSAEALGKEIYDFQLDRSRAIEKLRIERGEGTYPPADIALYMDMELTLEEYLDLESRYKKWIYEKGHDSMNQKDSSEERTNGATNITSREHMGTTDPKMAHILSRATLKAALDTGLYKESMSVLYSIDSPSRQEKNINGLTQDFKDSLEKELKEVTREVLNALNG